MSMPYLFFTTPATTKIYTLSLHDASSDLVAQGEAGCGDPGEPDRHLCSIRRDQPGVHTDVDLVDRKSTRLNSSHTVISYAVFCLKKKNNRKGLAKALLNTQYQQ